jgi:hypothetical protein
MKRTLIFAASLLTATLFSFASGTHPVLQTVLQHYSAEGDSLKRAAATFLFDNMEGHSYMTFDLVDSSGTVVPFDVLSFATYEALEDSFGALEDHYGTLDFKKHSVVKDDSVITSDFVIDHIDRAFAAWMGRPWAKGFSFQHFCEFILPYRGSNEPLEEWREYFSTRYDSAFSTMSNPNDPIEAARVINRDLMNWFHFDPRFYYHPTDQGLTEMLGTTLGRCEDMTNLTIFAMRANGLAVTSDYTPYWANSGNNHAWNAIVTADGKVIPFMGAEANPGEYQLANKLAKVYRKTYSIQCDNLAFQVSNPDDLPKYLSSKSYVDVTRDYVPVSDVALYPEVPDSVSVAYLCVFNSGEWKAIQWAKVDQGLAVFTDMGQDITYLPAYFANGKIVPAGSPFILDVADGMRELVANDAKPISFEVVSTTMKKLDESTDSVTKSFLTEGETYTLHYWKGGWQKITEKTSGANPLSFENVPSDGLYWLTAQNSDHEERIFTVDHNMQVWW